MPYEYQDLSESEKKNILKTRIERGYPLHAPPHPIRWEGYYLITAANYHHSAMMDHAERRDEFCTLLLSALKDIDAVICGWVILPNHYHFLVYVETLELISTSLKRLHGRTSYEWNKADGVTGKRRVWYRFSDRYIRNERHYYQALNYIHYNPCKHGYVQDPDDWEWSSLELYYEDKGRDWLREIWANHPITKFGDGWDD